MENLFAVSFFQKMNYLLTYCYNVSTTFSMDERDVLPASIRSGANVNVYPQFSGIGDSVASLKDFAQRL